MTARSLLDAANPSFDRVCVMQDGSERSYSYSEFMGLPLQLRIQLVLSGQPRFFLGERELDKRRALSLSAR